MTLQVSSRHCYACSPFPRATKNDTSMQRGPDCQSGSLATGVMSASHDHPSRGSNKSARAATIFIHNDAPQALLDCYENSFSLDVGSCGLGVGFEGDAIAEAFEAAFEVGFTVTLWFYGDTYFNSLFPVQGVLR